MTRIRQFAKDMGISYNKAKNLVQKGKKRRDGGSTVLENYMPIKIVAKKKEVAKPKPRPKNLKKKDIKEIKKIFWYKLQNTKNIILIIIIYKLYT